MIFDLVFALAFVLMLISGRKRGIINIVMGLVSGILAIILAFAFQASIKEALSETDFYKEVHTEISQSVEEKISGATDQLALLEPLIDEGYTSAEIADKVMSGCVSVLIFIAAFIVLRIAGAVLNAVFHLPVLRMFNGIAGMIWGAVAVIAVTYVLLALAGQFSVIGEAEFFKSQMESSILVKNMYENNILVKMFIRN